MSATSNENSFSATGEQQHKLIEWFRQATPYINTHRGKTFVVMIGSDAAADDNLKNIVHDIALLNSLGVRIVIVHGVRKQLDAKLKQYGIDSQFVHGWRVSDRPILDAAIQACSLVRSQLETCLSMGLPNSPMHGARVRVASGNVITARPAGVIDGVDLQHTGLVRKIDIIAINTLLNAGNLVLLSPLGYSPAGEAFSLAYGHVASEIALALEADKLIAFCESEGVMSDDGQCLRDLALDAARQLGSADDNLPGNLQAAIDAVAGGVPRAHIISYKRNGALLQELFTVDGAGTLISQDSFEVVRQATGDDIPAIIDIISPLEERGVLVRRDRDQLEHEIQYFSVIEREGLIIGLAALYPYQNADDNSLSLAEIACITTHPDYRNNSRGAKLLKQMEANALAMGIHKLFVLTTQATHWFIENGFESGQLQALPEKKQQLYNYQRNSKVLFKTI